MHHQGAIFLDRDHTLTFDKGYTHLVSDFKWMPGAARALSLFHKHGLKIFIVTNQGGIAKGLFSEKQMHLFHDHLIAEARRAGGDITDIAHCPHHPDSITTALKTPCDCRKPAPGLLLKLAEKWQIDLSQSVMIGDRQSDIEAGHASGCLSYLHPATGEKGPLDRLAEQVINTHFKMAPAF